MKYKGRLPSNALLPYYPDGNGETGYNYQIKNYLNTVRLAGKWQCLVRHWEQMNTNPYMRLQAVNLPVKLM